MLTVQTAPPLSVTGEQRSILEVISRSSSAPHRAVLQAKALLLCAVASRTMKSPDSSESRCSRARVARPISSRGDRVVGKIAKGRGRRSWLAGRDRRRDRAGDDVRGVPTTARRIGRTRTLAERVGVGKDTVARFWRDHELRPWKVVTFKISNDPQLRGEARRRRRALHVPARARRRLQLRREDPGPSARPHPAEPADDDRAGGHVHP